MELLTFCDHENSDPKRKKIIIICFFMSILFQVIIVGKLKKNVDNLLRLRFGGIGDNLSILNE